MTDIPVIQIVVVAALLALYLFMRIRKNRRRADLLARIESGATIVDVRSTSEFASGHYAGAINIPVDTLPKKLKALGGRETPIIVYCASGMRSANAHRILVDAGFTDVVNAGGMSALPVI